MLDDFMLLLFSLLSVLSVFGVFFLIDAHLFKKNGTCLGCRHWDEIGDSYGQCRRSAPVPGVGITGMDFNGCPVPLWPVTESGDWCGEWEAK